MATKYWIGGAPEIAQVDTITPGGTITGETFTITLADDAGNSHTLTASGATDVETACDAIVASAATAKTLGYAPWDQVTVADGTTLVTITVDTAYAGTRMYIDSSASGSATAVAANTTDNSAPGDWLCPYNWSGDALPANDDDIVIPATASQNINVGLRGESTTFDSFTIEPNCAVTIANTNQSLVVDLDGSGCGVQLSPRGTTFLHIKTGHNDTPIIITGAPAGGSAYAGLNIETDAVANGYDVQIDLSGSSGMVGFACLAGQAATLADVSIIGGGLWLGSGVAGTVTVDAKSSAVLSECNLSSLTGANLSTWTYNDGTCGTITLTDVLDARIRSADLAAGSTVSLYGQTRLQMGAGAGSLTKIDLYSRDISVKDPFDKIGSFQMHGVAISDVRLELGADLTWTAS